MHTCSLIIATVGRKQNLARLFDSLSSQRKKPHQIILVDQNPPEYLASLLERYRSLLDFNVLHTEAKGVSAARNMGLDCATGDIIAFPDDDCWYLPDTLEKVCDIFNATPELDGLIVSWSEQPFRAEGDEQLKTVTFTNAFRRAGTLVQFYRKDTLLGVRYDPLLGPGTGLPYGCGEDTDFLLQVLKKRHIIKRTSNVLVGHPEPDINDPKLIAKTYAYARGRMYLLRKHNLPFCFKLANILYPLGCLLHEGPRTWQYRKAMFWGRLKAFFQT